MSARSFGRYKIAEEVGRGAMGVVYRATDPLVGRTVAIKALNTAYLEGVGVRASEFLERFRREAEVAGGLSHPNIVKVFDLGSDFMVMEFVQGQSLDSLLRAHVHVSPDWILRVLAEVASALDYAHAQGVVHRDIKPANVMIQPDGTAKVMDFGLARVESSTLTAAGEILGSASYMAPEVILGRPANARSDVFSLGVVAYELVTGQRPFGGSSVTVIIQNVVRANPRPAQEVNGRLPLEYDAIFARVLAKDPAARYASALEFAGQLALRRWEEPEGLAGAVLPEATVDPGVDRSREAVGSATLPPAGDADAVTLLTADAAEVGLGRAAGSREVGAATVRLRVSPPVGTPQENADAPLASLIETLPPVTEVPTETQPAGSAIRRAALAAAAAEPREPGVATAPSVVPPAGGRGASPRKGLPLPAVLAAGAVVVVGGALALSSVAYRLLVQRVAGPEATVSPAPVADSSPTAATPPPVALEPPVQVLPEPTPEPTPPTFSAAPPALATLNVTSDPAGARVVVGRSRRGVTPLRLRLAPGPVSLRLEKDGFRPWKQEITLAATGAKVQARLEPVPPPPETAPAAPPSPSAPKAGDLVRLGDGVTRPRRIAGDSPRLSRAVTRLKLSGSVLLEFVVDENGRVVDPKVVESAGEALDAAALEAVRRWTYEPATSQGVRVKVVQQARFTFRSR